MSFSSDNPMFNRTTSFASVMQRDEEKRKRDEEKRKRSGPMEGEIELCDFYPDEAAGAAGASDNQCGENGQFYFVLNETPRAASQARSHSSFPFHGKTSSSSSSSHISVGSSTSTTSGRSSLGDKRSSASVSRRLVALFRGSSTASLN